MSKDSGGEAKKTPRARASSKGPVPGAMGYSPGSAPARRRGGPTRTTKSAGGRYALAGTGTRRASSSPGSKNRGKPLPPGHEQFAVRVVLDQPIYTLSEVAGYLAGLDQAWVLASNLAAFRLGEELSLDPPRPTGLRVNVNSPLLVELKEIAIPAGFTATAFGFFVYMLRHPQEISSWIPNLVQGWHEGWTEAERAKRERKALKHAASVGLDTSIAEANPLAALEQSAREVEKVLTSSVPKSIKRTKNVTVPK